MSKRESINQEPLTIEELKTMPELRSERHSESVQKRQRDLSILPMVRSEAKGGRG